MSFFSKMKEPVFLKEDSNAEEQLKSLKDLEPFLNAEGTKIVKQDIRNLEYGIAGEKNIKFELENSHMPMFVLHDIYLEDKDLNAQIDYLVVTKKVTFIIECKNLYGDIDINTEGDFVRTTEYKRIKKREGIYSPITQNQRHVDLMKKISVDGKKNILTKFISERYFDQFNVPIVVLANPKTVLNAKYAKKEVKNKVIRADQLVKYIKEVYKKSNNAVLSDNELLERAQSYLDLHIESVKDYTKKYELYKLNKNRQEIDDTNQVDLENKTTSNEPLAVNETEISKGLKEFRLHRSRAEDIKAYHIFSNKQLKALIEKMPKNKEELRSVKGFGVTKVNKYGDDIVRIIQKY